MQVWQKTTSCLVFWDFQSTLLHVAMNKDWSVRRKASGKWKGASRGSTWGPSPVLLPKKKHALFDTHTRPPAFWFPSCPSFSYDLWVASSQGCERIQKERKHTGSLRFFSEDILAKRNLRQQWFSDSEIDQHDFEELLILRPTHFVFNLKSDVFITVFIRG